MNKQVFTVGALSFSLFLVGCSSSQEASSTDPSVSASIASSTTSTQSEEERREELRQKLEAAVPVNQVDSGNLVNKCIMAIHEEIPNAGDYDFSTPVDLGEPDAAGIYSDGGIFKYELVDGLWQEASYFCTVYTEDGVITDASAIVIDKGLPEPAAESAAENVQPQTVAPATQDAYVAPAPASTVESYAPAPSPAAAAPVMGFTGAPGVDPIRPLDKTISHCGDPMMYQTGTTFFTDGTTGWTETCSQQMLNQ